MTAAASTPAPVQASEPEHVPPKPTPKPAWQKYGTPLLVVLLAAAVVFTITRNWNSWEGGRIEQVTDDAYVRGNLTPLSTKVPGIVRDVKVSDYQQVHKGDLIVELEDDDYQAQVAQASAAVEAAKAAIENNRRQRELQDSKIERALAGIDQAHAQITAAEAGIAAGASGRGAHAGRTHPAGGSLSNAFDDAAEGGTGGGRRAAICGSICKPQGGPRAGENNAAQQRIGGRG